MSDWHWINLPGDRHEQVVADLEASTSSHSQVETRDNSYVMHDIMLFVYTMYSKYHETTHLYDIIYSI